MSIVLANNGEWWVSRTVFERLFDYAVQSGALDPDLASWRDVAAANGGFHFTVSQKEVGARLTEGLRRAAREEVSHASGTDLSGWDEGYRRGLLELLAVSATPDPGSISTPT